MTLNRRSQDYETGTEPNAVLDVVTKLYYADQPHASLGYQKPAQDYYGQEKIKRGDLLDLTVADFSSVLGDSLDLT